MFAQVTKWSPAFERKLAGTLGTDEDKALLIDEVNSGQALAFEYQHKLAMILKDEGSDAFLICVKGQGLKEAWAILKPLLVSRGFEFLRYHTHHKGLARLGGEHQRYCGHDSNGCKIYRIKLNEQ